MARHVQEIPGPNTLAPTPATPRDTMDSAVLLDLTTPREAAWRSALERSGVHLGAASDRNMLVQRTIADGHDQLVCLAPGVTVELLSVLSCWNGEPPLAVLLLTPAGAIDAAQLRAAVAAGVHHWQALQPDASGAIAAVQVDAALAMARARYDHDRTLRLAAARAQEQLDERKWVDRAKGVLMTARGLDEDEAFRLLRGAAMSVNLRIGEVSRAVFEAARWADAMNRAGQLRMLSQRLVRLAAQRLLRIDTRDAATQAAVSRQRARENLDMLQAQCAGTCAEWACARAAQRWETLTQALQAPRLDTTALGRIDAAAARVLESAETLTEALQEAAGRRALHIVNQCGRQRMRVQRIAKECLLDAAHPELEAPPTRHDSALDAFESALAELEQAPLSTPEIRATLAQVRDQWLRLLGGLRSVETDDGRRALVQASEAILERLDTLTAAYEHSLQVIMA
jgi:AmiR/NasT family two-component response regulator